MTLQASKYKIKKILHLAKINSKYVKKYDIVYSYSVLL